jgi:uncharacterized protein DUF1016
MSRHLATTFCWFILARDRRSTHTVARSINAVMTTTYWLVGRRIVEQEQQGVPGAAYGEQLLKRLPRDLSKRFGRGYSERNLEQMRGFIAGPFRRQRLRNRHRCLAQISQAAPAKSEGLTDKNNRH